MERAHFLGIKLHYGSKKGYENNEEEKGLGTVSQKEKRGKVFQSERLGQVIWKKGFGKIHEEAWLQWMEMVWKKPGTIKEKAKAAAEEAEGDADQGAVILHDLMAVATLGNLKLQTISIGSAGKPLEKVLSLWDRLTGPGKDCLLVLLRVALEKALDCRLHRHGIAKR